MLQEMTPVGGKKRRSWRLKKKYNKWSMKIIQDFTTIALKEIPNKFFEDAFSIQDYCFTRK